MRIFQSFPGLARHTFKWSLRPACCVFAAVMLMSGSSWAQKLSDWHVLQSSPLRLEGVPWALQVLAGQAVSPVLAAAATYPHMKFAQGRLFASMGCNNLSSLYSVHDATLKFSGGWMSTKMGCSDDRGALEDQFIKTTGEVRQVRIQGQSLVLLNAQNQVLAQFVAVPAVR